MKSIYNIVLQVLVDCRTINSKRFSWYAARTLNKNTSKNSLSSILLKHEQHAYYHVTVFSRHRFRCLHKVNERFACPVFQVSTLVSRFKGICFGYAFSPYWCKRTGKTGTNVTVFVWIRRRVNAVLIDTPATKMTWQVMTETPCTNCSVRLANSVYDWLAAAQWCG